MYKIFNELPTNKYDPNFWGYIMIKPKRFERKSMKDPKKTPKTKRPWRFVTFCAFLRFCGSGRNRTYIKRLGNAYSIH